MQSVFQEPTESGKQYGSRTYDRAHQTARGGKALRGSGSFERTRQKTQDARTESNQLNHRIGGGKLLVKGTILEVDGASFARACSSEFGGEICGMAETNGETTMSTLSSEDELGIKST